LLGVLIYYFSLHKHFKTNNTMTKYQNLEKSLKTSHREATDLNLFRESIIHALNIKKFSWFELYCDEDKSYTGYEDLVRSYLYKQLPGNELIG